MPKHLANACAMDWSDLTARGLSGRDPDSIVRKMLLNRAIAGRIGRDRLQALRFEFSDSVSYDIMEEIFASAGLSSATACS
jgi:hypothetical protein